MTIENDATRLTVIILIILMIINTRQREVVFRKRSPSLLLELHQLLQLRLETLLILLLLLHLHLDAIHG